LVEGRLGAAAFPEAAATPTNRASTPSAAAIFSTFSVASLRDQYAGVRPADIRKLVAVKTGRVLDG
jgi:hypothetical protein